MGSRKSLIHRNGGLTYTSLYRSVEMLSHLVIKAVFVQNSDCWQPADVFKNFMMSLFCGSFTFNLFYLVFGYKKFLTINPVRKM
jgi:hypothetical protein